MIKFIYLKFKPHKNKSSKMIHKDDIKHKEYSHFLGFCSQLNISGIMKQLGFYKEKGVQPVYLMLNFFMFLLTATSILKFITRGGASSTDEKSTRSVLYRFLGNPSYNWRALQMRIALILSEKISKLTTNRRKFLIVDDSLYSRDRSKHTEMLSRVFDHVSQTFGLGFQYLNLCWTDGTTTLPCDFALVGAARKKECKRKTKKGRKHKGSNLINPVVGYDKRTIIGKRYEECTKSKPGTVINMIKRALDSGLEADCVLFDTWFATAPIITRIREIGLHVICMVKHMRNTSFRYKDKYYSLSELENILRQNLRDSNCAQKSSNPDILGSVIVETKATAKAPDTIKAKIVFIQHRTNPEKTLAILSTDMGMSDEDIVVHYSKRWLIEENFFNQKQLLGLVKKCRANLYPSIIAHVTMVNICTMILEYIRREEKDIRTFGQIFMENCEEIQDVPFSVAIDTLMHCFRKLVDRLHELKIIADKNIDKAYTVAHEMLNEWFRQQGEFFRTFIGKIQSDMNDLLSPK